jgi:hypothetical protein
MFCSLKKGTFRVFKEHNLSSLVNTSNHILRTVFSWLNRKLKQHYSLLFGNVNSIRHIYFLITVHKKHVQARSYSQRCFLLFLLFSFIMKKSFFFLTHSIPLEILFCWSTPSSGTQKRYRSKITNVSQTTKILI